MSVLIVFSQNRVCTEWLISQSVKIYYQAFLGITDIEPKIIRQNRKPLITNLDIKVSVSHSHNAIVCGVAQKDIGIDIEWKKQRDFKALSRRFFEKETEDSDEFYRLWTAKESYKKYSGIDLIEALRSTDYDKVVGFELFKDYSLSICTEALDNKNIFFIFR